MPEKLSARASRDDPTDGEMDYVDDVIRFEDVSRTFTGFAAVDRLTLSLRKGEILTLLGPSGCGKTTTLRMAIGLEHCTSGEIYFHDRLVDAPGRKTFVPPEARNMGIVFQSYAVWPHMTVFENVAFPLRMRRLSRDEVTRKVDEALRLVGLGKFSHRLGMQLSGGQQQRVAIARGLVFNPDVLLLDEPFSNLDAQLRDQMRSEVKSLQRSLGISILFVTHDQTEALALSDRLAVMNAGRIEQIGTPADIYFDPGTPFIRDFMGQWIKLPGKVEGCVSGEVSLRLADGTRLVAGGVGVSAGMGVLATVRPEHVAVSPSIDEAGQVDLRGAISSLLFLGPVFEARIRLACGQDVLVNLPSNEAWGVDQPVTLRIDPRYLHVWPIEGQGTAA